MLSVLWISKKYCPACTKLESTMQEVQEEFPDLEITRVDFNHLKDFSLIKRSEIFAVPVMVFYKDNEEKVRLVGNRPLNEIMAILDELNGD